MIHYFQIKYNIPDQLVQITFVQIWTGYTVCCSTLGWFYEVNFIKFGSMLLFFFFLVKLQLYSIHNKVTRISQMIAFVTLKKYNIYLKMKINWLSFNT